MNRQISKLRTSEQGYNAYASQYAKTHKHLDSFENGELIRMLPSDLSGKTIIDLGSGDGRVIGHIKKRQSLKNLDITAVDLSEEMLKIAKKNYPEIQTVQADASTLQFPDESVDIVIASFLIVHIRDIDKFFDEVYRVLKKGGIFLFTNIHQRHAPKLKLSQTEKIVIKSFHHMPRHVLESLDHSFFTLDQEKIIKEEGMWINQIIKASKN
ncbi:MAG TPA: class I SAM-dependent methyltransferase [Candidatus Gracilibacteria bacterium]|nr:class I SAM-dependent methyltransferase [Candidatus Gracilibacteria bacterium]